LRRILVVIGHPDADPARLCRALADSYEQGARSVGYEVRRIDVAKLDFPLLRSADDFLHGSLAPSLQDAVEQLRWAEHVVFIFPLWLGTMPALLKAFLEQVMRPGVAFAYPKPGEGGFVKTLLTGRSAHVVVTMGMPPVFYRYWYFGHGLAGMRRNILNFVGLKPVRETLFGPAEGASDTKRKGWIEKMRQLGEAAR